MLQTILNWVKQIAILSHDLSKEDRNLVRSELVYAVKMTKVYFSKTSLDAANYPPSIMTTLWQKAGRNIGRVDHPEIKILAKKIEHHKKPWTSPENIVEKELTKNIYLLLEIETVLRNK